MPAALRLLALEAGGSRLSAALFEDGQCVAQAFREAPQRQTESLVPLLQGLLRERNWRPESIGALAAGRGPGSFTGLRSSLALLEGFGFGAGARLFGIDTLEAWAESSGRDRVAVLLDGRRGQAYCGLYERHRDWEGAEHASLLDLDEALHRSDGWARISDMASVAGALAPPRGADLARAVGTLAWKRWAGKAGPSLNFEPLYLRRAEVEILWEKLHPKGA